MSSPKTEGLKGEKDSEFWPELDVSPIRPGPFATALIAGSAAGTAVDVILYPLDTVKTRLQSANGFWKTGGFSGIYRGVLPAFVGSAPNAAVFFATYDTSKHKLEKYFRCANNPAVHMIAASLGEITACIVRVPVEIVKQRRQALGDKRAIVLMSEILNKEGFLGFYRGYGTTILREIPFSVIQFPLWEYFKMQVAHRKGNVSPFESSLCGALAGGIAAGVTTPFDVAKTRIMLAEANTVEATGSFLTIWRIVYSQRGLKGLFSGVIPRTIWISFGGSIFFGTYELVKTMLQGSS